MRQTTCRQTSLPLAPDQGTDYTEDIKAISWHPFQFGRRQAVSACSGSPHNVLHFLVIKVMLTGNCFKPGELRLCHIISLKHGSTLNTRNDFICSILNVWCDISGYITSEVAVRSDSGVAGEGRVVGVPKFHS